MAVTQYIGSRYVPLFADPVEWSSTKSYEALTIVLHEGNSYTSKQAVPVGVDLTNEEFWAQTGNYNAQVEAYRAETLRAIGIATDIQEELDNLNLNFLQCVDYYGADPTGARDSSAAIRAAIAANPNGVIWFSGGTYSVSEPIVIPVESDLRCSIDFRGSTIRPTSPMPYLIGAGHNTNLEGTDAGYIKTFIMNGFLLNGDALTDTLNAEMGISVNTQYKNLQIENMNIKGFKKGIKLGRVSGYPCDAQISNCLIRYFDSSDADAIGIEVVNTDNKFFNLRIYGYHFAFDLQAGGSFITLTHVLPKNASADRLVGTAFARCHAGATFDNCYCDTLESFALVDERLSATLKFTNCIYYSYISPFNGYFVNFTSYTGNSGTIIHALNCTYYAPAPTGEFKNRSIKLNPNDNNVFILKALRIENCLLENYQNTISGDLFSDKSSLNNFWNNTNVPAGTWVPFCVCVIPTASTRQRIDIEHTHYFGDPQTIRLFGNFSYDENTGFDFTAIKFAGEFQANIGASGVYDATQNVCYVVFWYTARTASTNTNFSVMNNNPACVVLPVLPVPGYATWTNALTLQNIADAEVQLIRTGD